MNYLQMLSLLGVGGAHPGGISITKEIFEQEQFPISHTILDVGCGTGQTCYFLDQLGFNVIGLDHSPLMIQHALNRNKECQCDILYLQEDITSTSLKDHSVDVILSESVLNFTNPEQTLPEIKRILKPNGIIIAIEMTRIGPLSNTGYSEITEFYGNPSILSIDEWKKVFMKCGLSIYKIQSEEDFSSYKTDEPTTEFHITDSIPPSVFNVMSRHEELTLQYRDKLSYRVFFARRSV
ncbi:class I SAM-dependent methyltransferase [Metabacillus schmidteae]|uniref:class I SAM-dependent methyltransferase n=1 Tax=Metabacillus schmidteae TaxID=2730405 RepID=UPI001589C065|nr:class I SAM-dependent methyltransferase [Metabacillus schmidteae]